jgi:hypothetical protein
MRAMRKKLVQSRWSTLIPLAGTLAIMTANASAQVRAGSAEMDDPAIARKLQLEQLKRQKSLDDGYRAAVKGIPNQKPKDPWADVRLTPTVPAPNKKQQ